MESLLKQDKNRLKLFKKYGYDIPRARNFILAKAKLSKGPLLEVGTGKGHMTKVLAGKGFKLISIDLDKKAQREAGISLKAKKLDKLVTFKIMDGERLRFPDNCFNAAISVNFIHHAENPVKCLKEMVRVVKEKLIVADLNKRGERIMEKVHRLDGKRHCVSRMTLNSAKNLLEKFGMSVKTYYDKCQIVLVAEKGENV